MQVDRSRASWSYDKVQSKVQAVFYRWRVVFRSFQMQVRHQNDTRRPDGILAYSTSKQGARLCSILSLVLSVSSQLDPRWPLRRFSDSWSQLDIKRQAAPGSGAHYLLSFLLLVWLKASPVRYRHHKDEAASDPATNGREVRWHVMWWYQAKLTMTPHECKV